MPSNDNINQQLLSQRVASHSRHSMLSLSLQQFLHMKHPQSSTTLSTVQRRQLMHPMTRIVLGRLSSSSSLSIFFPFPQTGKLLSRLTSLHSPWWLHSSQLIQLGWIRLVEKVIFIFLPFSLFYCDLFSQHLHTSFIVVAMGDSVVWMIFPVDISLIESRGSPSDRQQVEAMLLMGQFSWDSLCGLTTLMLSMLFLTKNMLSMRTQQFSSVFLSLGELSLEFLMMMLELSNMHPWNSSEEVFLSSTEELSVVLAFLLNLSTLPVVLLCTDSFNMFFFSVTVNQRSFDFGQFRGIVLTARSLDFRSQLLFCPVAFFQHPSEPNKNGHSPPINQLLQISNQDQRLRQFHDNVSVPRYLHLISYCFTLQTLYILFFPFLPSASRNMSPLIQNKPRYSAVGIDIHIIQIKEVGQSSHLRYVLSYAERARATLMFWTLSRISTHSVSLSLSWTIGMEGRCSLASRQSVSRPTLKRRMLLCRSFRAISLQRCALFLMFLHLLLRPILLVNVLFWFYAWLIGLVFFTVFSISFCLFSRVRYDPLVSSSSPE